MAEYQPLIATAARPAIMIASIRTLPIHYLERSVPSTDDRICHSKQYNFVGGMDLDLA